MILKPITMAQLSGIGVSSVLGPGDSLPYGVVLGPLSCGLEANNSSLEAISKHHRNLVRPSFPEPSQLKPWFKFFSVVFVKRVIIGRFRAGPKGEWEHFQYWLTQKLIAKDGPLCGIHAMHGKHHFGVSWT